MRAINQSRDSRERRACGSRSRLVAHPQMEEAHSMSDLPNVVLVHGAWADGSSWSSVVQQLQAEGYSVTAPQFPETSLADDVARLRQVLNRQSGVTIVVGHSYGGPDMNALRTHVPDVCSAL